MIFRSILFGTLLTLGCTKGARGDKGEDAGSASKPTPAGATQKRETTASVPGVFSIEFPAPPKREEDGDHVDFSVWKDGNYYTFRRSADAVYRTLGQDARAEVSAKAVRAKADAYRKGEEGGDAVFSDKPLGNTRAKACEAPVKKPMTGVNYVRVAIANGNYFDATVFVREGSTNDGHEAFFASFRLEE